MNYIDINQAIEIHKTTVDVSVGGLEGIRDIGLLQGVLEHIQNDDYYPTFEDKLVHLFFGANKFHCFEDGNKRIAISLGAQFLLINGYVFRVKVFIDEMENISYHLAAGKIEEELLYKIIYAVVNVGELSEEIKFEIFNAISE